MLTGSKPHRAWRYGRVSTSGQNEQGAASIPDQDKITAEYVARKEWDDAGFVHDEQTGTDTVRPRWQELAGIDVPGRDRQPGLAQPGDVIVIHKVDRFARSLHAGINEIAALEHLGVDIVIVDPELDTTTMFGKAFRQMLLVFAELDHDMIIARMTQGARTKALDGRWPASAEGAPFGMRVERPGEDDKAKRRNAHLAIHPDEAATVHKAASLLLDEGKSVPEAAAILNSLGMLPRGQWRRIEGERVHIPAQWSPLLLRRQLQRTTLYGDVLWGAGRFAARVGKGKARRPKYGGGVQVANAPVVLDRTTWDRLQVALIVHEPAGRQDRYALSYPLSLRIESLCGKSYTGIYRNDRGLRSYRCQGKVRQSPSCDCAWLDADPLDDRVWAAVCDLLADPDKLTRLAREYLAIESGRVVSQADELDALRTAIGKLETQLASVYTAKMHDGLDPGAMAVATKALSDELGVLRRRRDEIERYRSDARAQTRAIDQAAELAEQAAGRLATMTQSQRAEVMRLLDIRVQPLDASRTPQLEITGTVTDIALLGDTVTPPQGYGSSIEV